MKIYYQHKESKQIVTLEELKANNNLNYNMNYYNKDMKVKEYSYMAYEIPLSDDWEMICDNTDFTVKELENIIYSLKYYPYNPSGLIDKVIGMFDAKRIGNHPGSNISVSIIKGEVIGSVYENPELVEGEE